MPWQDPKQYAMDYCLRYPALIILFYPPLFSVFLAGSYSIFGFSHAVAQGTVAFFHLALGLAVYMLARRWMTHGYAVAAALLLAGAPEIAFWGRQVMLDIPAYAWLAFMAVAFLRYLDHRENRYLVADNGPVCRGALHQADVIFCCLRLHCRNSCFPGAPSLS
jgi:predicted membrane-bound mannosyltransferase